MSISSASRLEFIEPRFPTLLEVPPQGDDWINDIKYDGWRTQIILEAGKARVFTRNGHDWTAKFRAIADAASEIDVASAILDGELVLFDDAGKPDYHGLKSAVTKAPDRLSLVGFDLLHIAGHDLRSMPCVDRRHILEDLFKPSARLRLAADG